VALLVHVSGVVVWMGAVSYNLFILQPSMRAAALDRPTRYALLRAIKRRIRVVVGTAVVAIVASGIVNAWLRGLLGGEATATARSLFHVKLIVATAVVLTFLFALPLLKRVKQPRLRGRLFTAVHVMVLGLGAIAAALGILIAG
jgi:uncharacterized membrane protein